MRCVGGGTHFSNFGWGAGPTFRILGGGGPTLRTLGALLEPTFRIVGGSLLEPTLVSVTLLCAPAVGGDLCRRPPP